MINAIIAFLILFGAFYFGINSVRNTTQKEKWQLTKLIVYSTICACLTLAVLTLIVIFF